MSLANVPQNFALQKDDVAQENKHITKSQENGEKMSLAMSLTMSLANVPRKTIATIQTKKQYTRTAFGDGILKESQG